MLRLLSPSLAESIVAEKLYPGRQIIGIAKPLALSYIGHEVRAPIFTMYLGIARYRVIDLTPKDDFIRRKGMEV
jgi:hypothetical protein